MSFLAQTTTSFNTTSEVDSGAAFAVLMVVYLAIFVLYAIPALYTNWKLFEKAGKPGWAAIIPIYNTYVMGEIAGTAQNILLLIIIGSLIPFISFFASIALIFFVLVPFVKSYKGVGVGFWVGYFLFPIVSALMVKKAEYIGANGSNNSASTQQLPPTPPPTAANNDQTPTPPAPTPPTTSV